MLCPLSVQYKSIFHFPYSIALRDFPGSKSTRLQQHPHLHAPGITGPSLPKAEHLQDGAGATGCLSAGFKI